MDIDECKQKIRERLKYFDKNISQIKKMMQSTHQIKRPPGKNVRSSELAKAEGNRLYQEPVTDPAIEYKILHLYNESIAFAPPESTELATAYGNKSALLRRMSKFKYCISEADKALGITQSIPLMIKLVCRKAECYAILDSYESNTCLEAAKFLLEKSEDPDKTKKMLGKMIDKAQKFIRDPDCVRDEVEIVEKAEMETLKIITEAGKSTSFQTSFEIKYSKKYGHHLVAARDFKPGEIMFVEKPYHTEVVTIKTPTYCCQCARFLWTIVPCEFCTWYVYCSEKCKTEAWNDYHQLECYPLRQLKETLPVPEYGDNSSNTYFFKALKEAGNIDQLQAELESLNKSGDHSAKHSITDENFLSYKTLFLTPPRNLSMDQLDDCLLSSCFVLINFVKPVLKVTYDPCDIKKLMKDETAIFMGALILKLRVIHMNRGRMAKAWDPVPDGSGVDPTISSTVLTSRLTPISCTPNVEHCPTSNNQYFMYAIEPIKAGSQLLSSVFETSIYCNTTKHERQSIHEAYYKSLCKCRACTDNWDSILFNPTKVLSIPSEKSAILEELTAELCSLKKELRTHSECTIGLIDLQVIDRARKLMIRAWEHFPMPSLFTFEVVNFVIQLFENVFPYKVAVTEILM